MTKPLSSRGEALDAATVDLLTDLAAEESSKKPRRRKKEKKKKAPKAPPLPREAPSAPVALPWADSDDSDEEETPLAPQRCDLRGFRAPAATEVVVALSITGRPEPAITAKLLDADLAGVAARDVLRKILKTRFLEAENPRITSLICSRRLP